MANLQPQSQSEGGTLPTAREGSGSCTFPQEVAQGLQPALLGGHDEGSDAVGVGGVEVGSRAKQCVAERCVVPGHGLVQGRPALGTALVHGGAEPHKEAHHVCVLPLARCQKHGNGSHDDACRCPLCEIGMLCAYIDYMHVGMYE